MARSSSTFGPLETSRRTIARFRHLLMNVTSSADEVTFINKCLKRAIVRLEVSKGPNVLEDLAIDDDAGHHLMVEQPRLNKVQRRFVSNEVCGDDWGIEQVSLHSST